MRTQASWEDQQQAMDAAKVLAVFANLEPDGVESFRTDHQDFVPQAWWDYRPTTPNGTPSPKMQWQINQQLLRDAWLFEFDMELGRYVHLLTSVFDPNEPEPPLFERHHRPAFVAGLDIGYELQDQLPYYLAVKWLGGHGWRAKECRFCKRRFVADHPQTEFCSFGVTVDEAFNIATHGLQMSCFWAHRKRKKHLWWIDHNETINKRRKRKYRAEKRRESHAKRKNLHQR
jgi:hypothetical protein